MLSFNQNSAINLNLLLYIITFIYCLVKYKLFNFSTILSLLYLISSISAFFLYNFPLYSLIPASLGEPSYEAVLYLYFVNACIIFAFRNCVMDNIEYILNYNAVLMKNLQKIIVIFMTIVCIYNLPNSINTFFSDRSLADIRDSLYGTQGDRAFFLIRWISIIFSADCYLALFIAITNRLIFHKTDKYDKVSVIIYFINIFEIVLSAISRSVIIFTLLELIITIVFFRRFISRKIKKYILLAFVVVFPLLYVCFFAITNSRVGKNQDDQVLSYLRYSGEAQLNFSNLMYGNVLHTANGYYQFRFFRQIFGFEYPEYNDRIGDSAESKHMSKLYHYPFFIFYSTAGDYYINWGPTITLLLAVFLVLYLPKCYKKNTRLSYMQLFYALFLCVYFAKGTLYTELSGPSENLLIILLIFLYVANKKAKQIYLIR